MYESVTCMCNYFKLICLYIVLVKAFLADSKAEFEKKWESPEKVCDWWWYHKCVSSQKLVASRGVIQHLRNNLKSKIHKALKTYFRKDKQLV